MNVKHLVIGSGGLQGLTCIGALHRIGQLDGLMSVTGTSIGSVIAALVATRMTAEQMMTFCLKIDFPNVFKWHGATGAFAQRCVVDRTLIREQLENIFEEILETRSPDFEFLFAKSKIHLAIVATCMNTRSPTVFSHETHPSVKIIDAIFASSALPFIFSPVVINGFYYIDGAVSTPLPVDICISKWSKLLNTEIGEKILVIDPSVNEIDSIDKIDSYTEYVGSILKIILQKTCAPKEIEDRHRPHVVTLKIDTGYTLLDMHFSLAEIELVLRKGFDAAKTLCDDHYLS